MHPAAFLVRRLISLAVIILGLTLIMFLLTHAVPGVDPLGPYITAHTSISQYAEIAKQHGLDKPLYIQYFYYLSGLLQGDWGFSASVGIPVTQAIAGYFPATLELTLAGLFISTVLGIFLGIVSATKSNKLPDHLARIFSIATISVPTFWFGLILQFIFFFYFKTHGLPYLPSNGRVDETIAILHPLHQITGIYTLDSLLTGNFPFFWSALAHLILPAVTLGLLTTGIIARVVRASVLDVMQNEFVTAARARAVPERVILYKHVMRNSLVPIISVLGLSFGFLLTGAVLTETVFSWHGMGQWAAQAILNNDSAAVIGFTLFSGIIFVVVNLVTDISYVYIDPEDQAIMIVSVERLHSIRKSAVLLKKNKVVLAGLAFAVFISLVAIIAPFVVKSKELALVNFSGALLPPSMAHWFGTDTVGRDLLQVMVAATSYDLFGTAIILLISSAIGIGLGAVAGYVGGKVDEIIMRVTDIFLALPALVLALAVAAVLGRTFPNLILAISFVWWSPICRIMRGQALSERNKPYVDTLVVFGVPRRRIIINHIIPNSIFPVFVYITTQVGFLILVFAGLNYIGFGPGPLTPEWGQLIANGQEYIFQDPTLIIFPGLAIFLTSMAFNLLGDGLRDVLNPRLRR